jgi:thioredoxin reductase (NADPH)
MHDVVIIGAGPAGLAAGLYAGRFRMQSVILEMMSPGGQILLSASIENYPGFPGGLTTQDLIDKFKQQVEEVGVPVESSEVLGITPVSGNYIVETSEAKFETKSVIIATGAISKRLGVKAEEALIGRGVSYCGTCDAPLFKNKDVVVVGGGDKAIEEAIYLASYASSVAVVHRRIELRASKILEEKAKANPKVKFILGSVVEEIVGANKVEAVKIKNVSTGKLSDYVCQGVFIFVGILPNTGFTKNLLAKDDLGFIIVDSEMKTSQAGIFAAGDCCRKGLYQVITACAEGATAADSAHKYLLERK